MRHYDDNNDDDDDSESRDLWDDPEDDVDGDEEDTVPEPGHATDPGVQVSMEIDEDGNEVWYASDARIPGSTSIGHSVEEAVEGVQDRRQQYREMLRRSRGKRRRRGDDEEPT